MSSHREAPEISKDPVADNADVYAFVSPDKPDTVTIITNYVPLAGPGGRPELLRVRRRRPLLDLHRQRRRRASPTSTYQFRFRLDAAEPEHVPLQHRARSARSTTRTGTSASSSRRRRKATRRRQRRIRSLIGDSLACPPCNIGPRSTPNYARARAARRCTRSPTGETVFAGQRNDPFFVDLGSIFDLGDLRPFQNLHLIPIGRRHRASTATKTAEHPHDRDPGADLEPDRRTARCPTDATSANVGARHLERREPPARCGSSTAPTTAARQSGPVGPGLAARQPAVQRGDRPARARRTTGTRRIPPATRSSCTYVQHPELASLLPVLYPGVFPNLAALDGRPRRPRGDPAHRASRRGSSPGSRTTPGRRYADMLRLNVAIPPASSPNPLGLLGGDLAGFPNGRRVFDDVVTIELRAIAGVTYPLVDKTFTPDGAASARDRGAQAGGGPLPVDASRTSAARTTASTRRAELTMPSMHEHHCERTRPHPEYVVLDIGGDARRADRPHRPRAARHGDRDQPPRATTARAATRTCSSASRGGRPAFTAVFDRSRRAPTRSGSTASRAPATSRPGRHDHRARLEERVVARGERRSRSPSGTTWKRSDSRRVGPMNEPQPLMHVRDEAEGDAICDRPPGRGHQVRRRAAPGSEFACADHGRGDGDVLTGLVDDSELDKARTVIAEYQASLRQSEEDR